MSKKVLVVDDSASVRQQVSAALLQSGFEVSEAADGQQAFDIIVKGAVSAVVCDVNMPRMNGIEMLEKLKGEGHMGKVPVLMLTTEGQPALIERAKAAGAKGWIVKPFKPDLLIKAVQKLAA